MIFGRELTWLCYRRWFWLLSFLYSCLVLFHSLRFAKPPQINPIISQTMSESQRYTSRTTGRVERRGAPAPYTPTKPAPKPVCHTFTTRLGPSMLTIPIRRRKLPLFGILSRTGLFSDQTRTRTTRNQNLHPNLPPPQMRPHHSRTSSLVIKLHHRSCMRTKRSLSPCKPRRQRTCTNAGSRYAFGH